MNKSSKTKLSVIVCFIFLLVFILPYSKGGDAEESIIGYKTYNETIEIWNTKTAYYFNESSGIQWTEDKDRFWTKNIFCLGYYTGETWNKIKCADELDNFNSNFETDNQTYVNITYWKDFTYGGYDMRLGIRYHLKTNDDWLSVVIYGKNLDDDDIPYELGFGWKVKDIKIGGVVENDKIAINGSIYNLNESHNLLFRNMSNLDITYDEPIYMSYYTLKENDGGRYIKLRWNHNLNYAAKLSMDNNQTNASVSLLINGGLFNSGVEKSTIIYWKDPAQDEYISKWTITNNDDPLGADDNGTDIWIGSTEKPTTISRYGIDGTFRSSFNTTDYLNEHPYDVTVINSTDLWSCDLDDEKIYAYDMNGTVNYYNLSLTTGNTASRGIDNNGTYFWVVDVTDDEVYRYYINGTYIDSWDVSSQTDTPFGITIINNNLIYITGISEAEVFKYDMEGNYLGSFDTSGSGNANPYGITSDGEYIWVVDRTDKEVYKYYHGYGVSACGTLSEANTLYVQEKDIEDNGLSDDCIKITAKNITFDGSGFLINSSRNYDGIEISDDYCTVKNTNISMGTTGNGIHISDCHSCYIVNNSLHNQYRGLWISSGTGYNTTIYSNTIFDNFMNLRIYGADECNITRNTIRNSSDSESPLIKLSSADNTIIKENVLESRFDNTSSSYYSIETYDSDRTNITNNNITYGNGITINFNSDTASIESNNFNDVTGGITIETDNVISKNNYYKLMEVGNLGQEFSALQITGAFNSLNIRFENEVVNGIGSNISHINYDDNGGNSAIFLNCSYNVSREIVSGATLIRKFYIEYLEVNDSSSKAILSGVNISNTDGSDYHFSEFTNSTGNINSTNYTSYKNIGGTRTHYNISLTKNGYYQNASNYTGNLDLRLLLSPDTSNPGVVMNIPTNGSTVSASSNFSVNITDDLGIKNATLYLYNTTNDIYNQTTTSFDFGITSTTLGTVVSLNEDIYEWFYIIYDWVENLNISENRTINVDATFPSVNLSSPTRANYTTTSVDINFTITDSNLDTCWYYNGTGNITIYPEYEDDTEDNSYCYNLTGSCSNGIDENWDTYVVNFTANSEVRENYTIEPGITSATIKVKGNSTTNIIGGCDVFDESQVMIYCYNDTSSDWVGFETMLFCDNFYGNRTENIPLDCLNSTLQIKTYIKQSFVQDENHYYEGMIIWNWTNFNLTNVNFPQGWNNVTIYANDSVNNINDTESVEFFVDSLAPTTTPTMTSPPDGASYSNGTWTKNNVKVTLDTSDSGIGFDNLVYPKYCTDTTNTCTPNTYISSGKTVTTEGVSYIRYNAQDYLGNAEVINSRTIKIDSTSPNLTIDYPTAGLLINYNTSIPLNFSTVDNLNSVDSCWYNTNNGINITLPNCQNGSFNATEGSVTINVFSNDTLNNINTTESITFTIDVTNPALTIETPLNKTYSQSHFSFNITATETLTYCNFTLNDWTDYYNMTKFNTTLFYYTNESIADGQYTSKFQCNDSANNFNITEKVTFIIDTTNPLINFTSNTNLNGTWRQTGDIFLNVSVTESGQDQVQFEWNSVNETFANNNGNDSYWENKTGLSTGTYIFYAWVNDTAGNYNQTEKRTIYVDLENPSIIIDHPKTQSYNTNNITLNYSAIDTNLDSCWWGNSTDNTTMINCQNVTINMSEGSHTLFVWANDSSGREGYSSVSFSISLAPPSVSLDFPSNNLWLNYKTIDFNITATHGSLDSCEFWTNTTGSWALNQTNSSLVSGITTSFTMTKADGFYDWNVKCNETTDNYAWGNPTKNNTFFIDSIKPQIEFGVGTQNNDTNITYSNIYINLSVTELNFDTMIFTLWNETSVKNTTTYLTSQTTFNWTSLSDDYYLYNVTINDSAGNKNYTETRYIRIDSTAPTITIAQPLAQNYGNNNTIELNFTASDNLIGIDECWYRVYNCTDNSGTCVEDTLVISSKTIINCLNTSFELPGGDINYELTLFSKDKFANTNSKSVTFGIRTESPAIALNPLNDTHTNILTGIFFNFTATTNADSIDTCKLYGDFNTTWELNQTITTVLYDGSQNNFNEISLLERDNIWNVWCNDSLNNVGYALNNLTFVTDITFPNITIGSISTTQGSQTITFNSTSEDKYSTTCKYSIYNSTNNIDGLNENISYTCNSDKSATVTAFATYNLTVYTKDKAGNENSTTDSFITSPAPTTTTPGGGGAVTGKTQTTNFTIVTTGYKDLMDFVLAKDSVKSRTKYFFIVNTGLDSIKVDLECDTGEIISEKDIDICDYVEFEDTSITVEPSEVSPKLIPLTIRTPHNLSFGDIFKFNIIASTSDKFSKLSVASRVPIWGQILKWSYIPLTDDRDNRPRFPVASIAVLISFTFFTLIFLLLKNRLQFTSFILGVVVFFSSFVFLLFFL